MLDFAHENAGSGATPPAHFVATRSCAASSISNARHGRIVQFALAADGHSFAVTGQTARALQALVRAGHKGVTALEMSTWALRLGAYVHTLRRDHGLVIETVRERHNGFGDWHGRYILRTPVTLIERGAA